MIAWDRRLLSRSSGVDVAQVIVISSSIYHLVNKKVLARVDVRDKYIDHLPKRTDFNKLRQQILN